MKYSLKATPASRSATARPEHARFFKGTADKVQPLIPGGSGGPFAQSQHKEAKVVGLHPPCPSAALVQTSPSSREPRKQMPFSPRWGWIIPY